MAQAPANPANSDTEINFKLAEFASALATKEIVNPQRKRNQEVQ